MRIAMSHIVALLFTTGLVLTGCETTSPGESGPRTASCFELGKPGLVRVPAKRPIHSGSTGFMKSSASMWTLSFTPEVIPLRTR
jgi:hypothetical protein